MTWAQFQPLIEWNSCIPCQNIPLFVIKKSKSAVLRITGSGEKQYFFIKCNF